MRRDLTFLILGTVFGAVACAGTTALAQTQIQNQGLLPQRLAYAFGNSAYRQGMALRNATLDAGRIRDALNKVGFNATTKPEMSSRNFRSELAQLRTQIRGLPTGSTVLIYYSGHGFNVGNRSYLAPVDFDFSSLKMGVQNNALVSVSELVDSVSVNPGVKVIVVIDACRNIANLHALSAQVGGMSELSTPPNVMMVYAAQAGMSASDGLEGEGSPLALAMQAQFQENASDANVFFQKVSEKVLTSNKTQRIAIYLAGTSPGNVFSVPDNSIFCGNCYLTKLWSEKKYAALVAETASRAQKGDAEAMHWLGTMYDQPAKWGMDDVAATKIFGKTSDIETALIWYRRAARAKRVAAVYSWAEAALRKATDRVPDYKDALAAYEQGAALGDKESVFLLGCAYSSKPFGILDFQKAAYFYSQALDVRNCCGALNLAAFYHYGKPGIPEDRKEAKRLYEIAAARGNGHGFDGLGTLAVEAKDYVAARHYFEQGMAAGTPNAYYLFGSLLWNSFVKPGPDEARVRIQAITAMRKAHDLAAVQNAHETGLGDKDPSTGKEYYTAEFYQAVADMLMKQDWVGNPNRSSPAPAKL